MAESFRETLKTIPIALCVITLFTIHIPYAEGDIPESLLPRKELLYAMLQNNGFSDDELNRIFSDPRVNLYPAILKKTGKGINYLSKKFGLLTPESIKRGQQIMRAHQSVLESIEKTYGVEKEFIIAIMRIETDFGKHTGTYPIFNSLLTYILYKNRRSEWAEKELISFLTYCKQSGIDPLSINGSWAGAFGLCQFIPTSFFQYGVDGNGDGKIDLFDFDDASVSIANYLKSNGWQKNSMKQKKKALYAYNHCHSYVRAVVAYAQATRNGTFK